MKIHMFLLLHSIKVELRHIGLDLMNGIHKKTNLIYSTSIHFANHKNATGKT